MEYFTGKNDVYIIAEIGGNHEGDFDYALELTKLAAESGADAVKYQIYTGDSLVNAKYDPERNMHFKKFELTNGQYIELAELCKRLGVTFMASVWNENAIKVIDQYSEIYKVGSGDLTAYSLIDKIIATGKPIILSTGLCNFSEVEDAVEFIQSIDSSYVTDGKLALLQCSSMYPIPDEDANLNVIKTYMKRFNLPVGYSDHTVGTYAVEVAAIMGAQILEVHFTDTRDGKEFRDHQVSLTKTEISTLIERIKKVRNLQGSTDKVPTPSEVASGHVKSFRRSLYVKHDLRKGHLIREEDLVALRPVVGLGAQHYTKILGHKLNKDLSVFDAIRSEDVD